MHTKANTLDRTVAMHIFMEMDASTIRLLEEWECQYWQEYATLWEAGLEEARTRFDAMM